MVASYRGYKVPLSGVFDVSGVFETAGTVPGVFYIYRIIPWNLPIVVSTLDENTPRSNSAFSTLKLCFCSLKLTKLVPWNLPQEGEHPVRTKTDFSRPNNFL
jgi:hypothetical protein